MTTSPSDEFLADLEQVLKDQGVEPDKARAAAVAIGVQWGGQSVYIRLRGLYLARAIAARADRVYEVVCGLSVCWKGETT